MKQDLFDEKPIYDHNKFVKEVIRITYEKDFQYLYQCARFLTYEEFKDLKNKIIENAVNRNEVINSDAAKQKYWERVIQELEDRFGFKRPLSNTVDAVRKRTSKGF